MREVVYHSLEWDALVEQGWVTMYVERVFDWQYATMIYCPERRR